MEVAQSKRVPFGWPAAWKDPGLVGLLAGGPINCVVVGTGAGNGAIAQAARKAGLEVLEEGSLGAAPLGEIPPNTSAAQVVIKDLVWPRIKMAPRGGPNDAQAGPTGAPWIDSNCWAARLAAVRMPGKPLWLDFEPDAKESAPTESAYAVAIADSWASGARWLLRLDAELSRDLAAGAADATRKWRGILAAVRFFEQRPEWGGWEPWGPLGVLSSFAGEHEFLGQEMLNLASRRNLLYRVLDRSIPASHRLEGLRAVLYVDNEPPAAALKDKLTAFARQGGLLIVPRALAAQFPLGERRRCPVAGYELQTLGKGAVARAVADWEDPFFLAADAHSLVSRRHDPVRLFNGRSLWAHYALPPEPGRALLQLVSFSGRQVDSVTVAGSPRWRSVTMHTLGAEAAQQLAPVEVEGRTEFQLPRFSIYAALEFSV